MRTKIDQLRGKTTKDDKDRRVTRININTDNNILLIIFDAQGYAIFIDTNHNPIINGVVVPVEDTTRVRMI